MLFCMQHKALYKISGIDRHRSSCFVYSFLCGDKMSHYVKLNEGMIIFSMKMRTRDHKIMKAELHFRYQTFRIGQSFRINNRLLSCSK